MSKAQSGQPGETPTRGGRYAELQETLAQESSAYARAMEAHSETVAQLRAKAAEDRSAWLGERAVLDRNTCAGQLSAAVRFA